VIFLAASTAVVSAATTSVQIRPIYSVILPFSAVWSDVKVKLSLTLIEHHAWGSGGIAPPFLTRALDGGEWSASRPCHFTPGERAPLDTLGGPQSRSESC
jgi:hypothetical protein